MEARAVKDDPVDLAEIRAIQEDWAALHADEALAFVLDLQPEPSQPEPSQPQPS